MLKKHFHKILLLFITLGVTSLQATKGSPGTGKYSDDDDYCIITNDKYKLENLPLDNSLDRAYLEGEKDNFSDNNITKTIKDKKGVHFFMMIASNNKTKGLNKFFFFNRAPGQEPDAIRKVSEFYKCHVISHTTPILSPHIIFQVLGWLTQEERKYTPIFIHSNCALCTTCHALAFNLFNLNMPTNPKGCSGAKDVVLENISPLAQRYINSRLTIELAQKILLPKVAHEHKQKINEVRKNLSDQIKLLKNFLRNGIKEVNYSPLKGHGYRVWSVAISSDNKYIVSGSGCLDHTIRIWDLKRGKELDYSPLNGHTAAVKCVAITSDNKYIVSASRDKTIRIWDLKTGKELLYSPLKGHTCWVRSVAVTNDNKFIVSGSEDKTIRIWDLKTGKQLSYCPLNGHTNYVNSVAITKDNKYIVSGSNGNTIRIWDFSTGKQLPYSPLKGHTNYVNSVAITRDNKYIVSGSGDHTIRIWDFKTGKELLYSPLKGHTSWVRSVALTKDNKYIVSGSDDKTIRIWDFKTGKQLPYSPLKGHTNDVNNVAVTNDNKYIVSGSDDKTIRIWDIKLLQYLNEDDCKQEEVFDID